MPIIDLQMRMRQLGEIRIGHVVATGKPRRDGKPGTRPAKLNHFRFTSPSREILTSVAELYGGDVQPWTPANGGPSEFEVYSTTNRLPVLIPPRDAVSQWYELYAGSRCQRRCDGVTEHKRDRPCLCDPDNRECKITTRVNVMLRDVPALGQWLLITKGYYAATELPPAAELLAKAGGYVAGWLGMEEKLVQRDEGPARFMVPTLDVEITPTALMAGNITGGAPAVASGPERVAITGGRPDYAALAAQATTSAEVGTLWTKTNQAGHLDDATAAMFKARAAVLKAAEEKAKAEAGAGQDGPHPDDVQRLLNPADYGDAPPDEDGAIDAEVIEDDDVEDLWFRIIAAAGVHGMTTEEIETEFARANGGQLPATATAPALRTFLTSLKGGRA
ncbi:recombination directionality factor [Streptomyces cyaneofuscatus]|uniref:recombination directionality factor n=1 Tax=Streptomyces cyaneofuscatus TaxID=66883 RepID=UPI00343644AF